MSLNKVVITGLGVVSPYGIGVAGFVDNLLRNQSAVINMQASWQNTISDLNSWVGAPVQEDLNEKSIPRKFRKTMGRSAILATLACREAVSNAGLEEEDLSSGLAGVSFGSSTGSVDSTDKFFTEANTSHSMRQIASGMFFQIMSHTTAANIAQIFNITGRVISPNAACSSSAQAIGLAYEAIQRGTQDIMLCGGADELHVMTNVSFDVVQAASYKYNDRPQQTPRPFDADRDGTVCGEGAGCIVLESEASAKKRGVPILGEVAGFASTSGGINIAQANSDSIASCIRLALKDAAVDAESIDYINAHATGTLLGDVSEARAIAEVFGERVPVSGLKGHFGHTLGASAVLELIGVLELAARDVLPATRNLNRVDADCGGIQLVRENMTKKIKTIVKNSFAFGGINTVLIIKRNHS